MRIDTSNKLVVQSTNTVSCVLQSIRTVKKDINYCEIIANFNISNIQPFLSPSTYDNIIALRWRQTFIQPQIKRNIKALHHWPLCGEFTGDRWIPAQRTSNAENVSIWWRHHGLKLCVENSDLYFFQASYSNFNNLYHILKGYKITGFIKSVFVNLY